jgi:hypothetical protein
VQPLVAAQRDPLAAADRLQVLDRRLDQQQVAGRDALVGRGDQDLPLPPEDADDLAAELGPDARLDRRSSDQRRPRADRGWP